MNIIRSSILAAIVAVCATLPVFADQASVDALINEVNAISMRDKEAAVFPDVSMNDPGLFDREGLGDELYYSQEWLGRILGLYTSYGACFGANQNSFVYLHIGMLAYFSDFIEWYWDFEGVDRVQLLNGFAEMLNGSITITAAEGELDPQLRLAIGEYTYQMASAWWEDFTPAMRSTVFLASNTASARVPAGPIKDVLLKIKGLMKI